MNKFRLLIPVLCGVLLLSACAGSNGAPAFQQLTQVPPPTSTPTSQPTSTPTSAPTSTPSTITITSGLPPSGEVNLCYGGLHPFPNGGSGMWCGFELDATGGIEPYNWSWAAATGSSLPPGFGIFNANFPFPARILGPRPRVPGTYNVIVTVADSELPPVHTSINYTITITPCHALCI